MIACCKLKFLAYFVAFFPTVSGTMPHMKRKRRFKQKKTYPRPFAKRLQWTNQSMEAAMEAVRKGTMSMNKAAKIHGVPCTTLKDRMSGKVVHGKKPG